jgi:hypothetical protein
MAYNTKYRIEFDTIKGRSVKVDIEEDGFSGSVTNLIASGETPLEINYPNGEFDKMTGIRESKIRIKVLSTNVDISDFLIISDTQYKVKVYINNTVEWLGWLDNDYITEEFLDTPVVIELSASDGLSLAKSIDLSDLSNNQVWGLYRVKEFIAYALDKTGLGLDFYSFINMFPAGFARTTLDNDAFYYSYITSHTFLRGPREFDDAYTVLSKIMQAFGCTLFQARGAWYIIQTNDRVANDLDGNRRNASGTYQENHLNQSFVIDIGLNEVTKLINADALTSWEKEFKETVIKYSFKMPPIFFRNWDLIDGTFSSPLSGTITRFKLVDGVVTSFTLQRQVYELENWVESSNAPSVYPVTYEPYTGVEIDTNTSAELVRYLMFYSGTEDFLAGFKGITTTSYPVNKDDVFSLSYATREKNTGFKNNAQGIFVRIYKSNGDYYFLEPNGRWRFEGQGGISNIGKTWERAEDRRFWKEYSIESEPIPENGLLSIMFSNFGHSRTANNEVHFKDLSVEIKTYFNEMLEVDGYEYKNSQANELKNLYDNEIFVSKSDNIGTQGAILTDSYAQVPSWKYSGANDNTAVAFAKYISRGYWRAMYRNFQRMEGRLYDLYQGSRLLSLLNTVQFSAITDKEFMITTLNIDVRNEAAEFTMVELRSTANNNDFTETGTEAFKYLNIKARNFDDVIKEPRTPIEWRYGTAGIVASLLRRNKRRRFNNYS